MSEIKISVDTPESQLVRIGLKHIREVEAKDGWEVDMGEWGILDDGGKCHVCFAGAVFTQGLGVRFEEGLKYLDLRGYVDIQQNHRWNTGLAGILNSLKSGLSLKLGEKWSHATGWVYLGGREYNWSFPDYHIDRDEWFSAMEKFADALEKREKACE